MADILLVSPNGRKVQAPVEIWLMGLVMALDPKGQANVCAKVENILAERMMGRTKFTGDGLGALIVNGNGG